MESSAFIAKPEVILIDIDWKSKLISFLPVVNFWKVEKSMHFSFSREIKNLTGKFGIWIKLESEN